MNRTLLLLSVAGLAFVGCNKADKNIDDGLQPASVTKGVSAAVKPVGHPNTGGAIDGGATPSARGQGKVLETMNAGGYTYVRLEGASEGEWAAGPESVVKVGDRVSYQGGMLMQDFRSNTLNRTFKNVYFVPAFSINGAATSAASVSGANNPGSEKSVSAPADVDLKGIAKAKGGKTVAEVFAEKAKLSGMTVILRGKVVKYNAGIMDRNWLHVRDGSGADGTNDLTITTSSPSAVGATVLVKGVIALDKDFGAGYKYDVIVENAIVTTE